MATDCGIKKDSNEYEVVVYGGTSAGISAAIQTSRMGKIGPAN
jgi:tRNA U34 5-carboxymethylaminomethyl modifying enzyme MnmG/GidA